MRRFVFFSRSLLVQAWREGNKKQRDTLEARLSALAQDSAHAIVQKRLFHHFCFIYVGKRTRVSASERRVFAVVSYVANTEEPFTTISQRGAGWQGKREVAPPLYFHGAVSMVQLKFLDRTSRVLTIRLLSQVLRSSLFRLRKGVRLRVKTVRLRRATLKDEVEGFLQTNP